MSSAERSDKRERCSLSILWEEYILIPMSIGGSIQVLYPSSYRPINDSDESEPIESEIELERHVQNESILRLHENLVLDACGAVLEEQKPKSLGKCHSCIHKAYITAKHMQTLQKSPTITTGLKSALKPINKRCQKVQIASFQCELKDQSLQSSCLKYSIRAVNLLLSPSCCVHQEPWPSCPEQSAHISQAVSCKFLRVSVFG